MGALPPLWADWSCFHSHLLCCFCCIPWGWPGMPACNPHCKSVTSIRGALWQKVTIMTLRGTWVWFFWLGCTSEQRSCVQSFLASSLNVPPCCVQDPAAETAEAARAAAEARLPPEPADGGSRIGEPCSADKGRHAIEGSCIPSQQVYERRTALQSAQPGPCCWPQMQF